MRKKIVVTGATGLIGKTLCKRLIQRGDEVTVFTRNISLAKHLIPNANEYVYWNEYESKGYSDHLEGKDTVVHLAGANIGSKRWTGKYKDEILRSRLVSTRILRRSLDRTNDIPKSYITASAVGFYGNTLFDTVTENFPNGNDFLSRVCRLWEAESNYVEEMGLRRAIVRTGIVLSPEAGILNKMIKLFKYYLGGTLGNGRQYFSWIHLEDIVNIYIFLIDNTNLSGIINGTAPNPVTLNEFTQTVGEVLNRPANFRYPGLFLKILLGQSAETILLSQKVIPKRLLENGFSFKFGFIDGAMNDLLHNLG
jgi:hypothetical protein